jgi:hypothetical protein
LANPFDGSSQTLRRQFIPARLSDNPSLLASDPDYVARLRQSGSDDLVRAWLEGDWSIVDGAFFDKWSRRNVVRPFRIPDHWTRIRSFDWGYAAPFSVGWWAVVSDTYATAEGTVLPRGALVRYREWYGRGPTGEGLRLEAEAVARGVLDREASETIALSVADPSIFREDGGPSLAERMRRAGVRFRPADNTRVGKAGALSGWDQMRARIAGDAVGPMLVVFDTCRDFIRTVPVLQHDPGRPEDLDTRGEDHAADEARYACLTRPIVGTQPAPSAEPRDYYGFGRRERPVLDWKVM